MDSMIYASNTIPHAMLAVKKINIAKGVVSVTILLHALVMTTQFFKTYALTSILQQGTFP